MGTLGPHFPWRMGTWVPVLPGEWGPRIPISRQYGDLLVKMGTPCMADCFHRSMKTICMADHYHKDMGIPYNFPKAWDPLYGRSSITSLLLT